MSDLEKRLTQIALDPAYHDILTILKVSTCVTRIPSTQQERC